MNRKEFFQVLGTVGALAVPSSVFKSGDIEKEIASLTIEIPADIISGDFSGTGPTEELLCAVLACLKQVFGLRFDNSPALTLRAEVWENKRKG